VEVEVVLGAHYKPNPNDLQLDKIELKSLLLLHNIHVYNLRHLTDNGVIHRKGRSRGGKRPTSPAR
jgi:hypothetical protein